MKIYHANEAFVEVKICDANPNDIFFIIELVSEYLIGSTWFSNAKLYSDLKFISFHKKHVRPGHEKVVYFMQDTTVVCLSFLLHFICPLELTLCFM